MIEIDNINGLTFSAVCYNIDDVYKQSKDKDHYEEVIDFLTLEKYSSDQELKNCIKNSVAIENKRIAIASVLSNNNALWAKIKDLLDDNSLSSYNRLKEVYIFLKEYVKIVDVKGKEHGEILTPFNELAEPMVRLVEKYDINFWKNRNHKVLDSSAGYGTFLILSAYKFMIGLKDDIEDEEERFKWIVENCLYYGELQVRSAFSWLLAIDPYDKYKTNTYFGSFLDNGFDKHMKEVWEVEKFDLIIQNPPYQERKEGFVKTQPIWNLFVEKSIKLLNDDKFMVMVHPNGWRNIDGIFKPIQNLIKERQLLEIKIFSDTQAMNIFGVSIFFDYYILKNTKSELVETLITTSNNQSFNSDISKLEFIPDGYVDEIESLIAGVDEERIHILHSFSAYETRKKFISEVEDIEFRFPCISNVYRNENIKIVYSSTNNRGHFNIPKLVCGMASSGSNFFIDISGEYAMTQFSFGIIDDVENLEKIKIAMKSKKFQRVIECIPNNSNAINFKILKTFRKDFWKEFI